MKKASKDSLYLSAESDKPWIQTLRRLSLDSIYLAIVLLIVYFSQTQHDIYDHIDKWVTAHGVNYHDLELLIFSTAVMLLIFTTRGTIDFYREVRKRREVERALREEYAKSQRYLDIAAVMIILIDAHQRIELINKKGLEILGYSEDEIIGKNWFETFIPEERHDELRMIFINMMSEQIEPYTSCECWINTKDKGHRLLILQNVIIRDTAGMIQGMLSSGQDVTERHEAELALATKSEELERSNIELEQFAYIASHDLQEPLRMILSFVDLLKLKMGDRLDDDVKEYMYYIVKSASWMQLLINDLLTYSRVTTRANPFEPVSLNDILTQATFNLKTAIDEKKAVISAKKLPDIMADKTQMIQVFQNLIGNAIKFCDKDHPEIELTSRSKDGFWRITVRDNGIGMDMKYAPRIFKVFERLHAKDAYPGTGIGLAVSKKIIERHSGSITVESVLGKGSKFILMLPKVKG